MTAAAFHGATRAYFVSGKVPGGAGSIEAFRMHAAATLAAADAIAPCEGAARDAMMKALLPPRGWWATSGGAATSGSTFPTPSEKMEAARALFSRRDACATVARARCVALLSTLRVLMLVVPAGAASRAPPAEKAVSAAAAAAAAERDAVADLTALLDDDASARALAGGASAAVVAAARGFARALLRRRFADAASLRLLRRLAVALGPREDAPTNRANAKSLETFARDAFERAASHSAAARALLDPAAATPLPPAAEALGNVPASILPAAADDDDGGGSGGGLADDRDDADDADVEKRPSMTDGARRNASARESANPRIRANPMESSRSDAAAVKLELVALLRASWRLHVAATTREDSIVTRGFAETIDSREAEDDDSHTDASHPAAWRADQAGLIPLLAASYGATLSPCDRHLAALLTSLDAAAGGGRLAGLGYLWGESASYFVRTRAAIRRASGSTSALEEDAEERRAAAAESIAAALRGGAPPDARRCAATAVRFPHARGVPAPPPSLRGDVSADDGSLSTPDDGAGPAPAAGYDPAWVLPFARNALSVGAVEPRDFVAWGVLSLACAALACGEESTRAAAYACLRSLSDALELSASFREKSQVASLLGAIRNAVPRDAPLARLPTATAVFAAEAAAVSLHPASDAYVPSQRAVLRRAALDVDALPVSFLGALNGAGAAAGKGSDDANAALASRGEARALRVWILRLLLASLRGGPEDARLFRKAFALEVLMSHRSAALTSDPYARQLTLDVIARAARCPAASRALVDGSGVVPWLAATARAACRPTRAHAGESASTRAAAAATATIALANLAEQRGAFYGGPTGTAVDFLAAARDVRVAVMPLAFSAAGGARANPAETAARRAALLPALRLHVAVSRRLSRRLGEVADASEVAALCRAADTVDDSAVREAMLDVVCASAGAGRNGMFAVGGDADARVAAAGAAAVAAVVPWAAAAAATGRHPRRDAARVLRWAANAIAAGGSTLAAAMASEDGGGGAARFAAALGALRDAAGPETRAEMEPALVRAQTALLRAVVAAGDAEGAAAGDDATRAAMRRPAYAALLSPGGALEELADALAEAEADAEAEAEADAAAKADTNANADAEANASDGDGATRFPKRRRVSGDETRGDGGVVGARGAIAAALAATLLRAAFAATPPLAFVRHVVDLCGTGRGTGTGMTHRFKFEREWEGMRLADGGVADSEGAGRAWRLGAMLREAWGAGSAAAAGGAATSAAPSPVARAKKRARVVL